MRNLKTHLSTHMRIWLLQKCEYYELSPPSLGLTEADNVWQYILSEVWIEVETVLDVVHSYERVALDTWIGSVG